MSNKIEAFLKNMDKGFYHEARREGRAPGALLADYVDPERPEVERVHARLLKKMRREDDGGYVARALWEHAEQVVSLEKCFEQRKIHGGLTLEKAFFSSGNDTNLFPVFLSTMLIQGQLAGSLVPRLSMGLQRIETAVAEKITMNEAEGDRQLKFTGEGSDLPKTTISRAEGQVTLYKYGRILEWTYETARRMTLDIVGAFIQRMGVQLGVDESNDLIEVLIAGDGTASSAVTDTDAEVSGTLDYDELIRLFQAFGIGYMMSDAVINDANLRTILNMSEFKDPAVQLNFQRNGMGGELPILGATFHRWTSTGSTSFSTDRIVAVDSRFAINVLQEGDFLEESDQLIDRQLNRRALSVHRGYMKLDNNATQCLDITT